MSDKYETIPCPDGIKGCSVLHKRLVTERVGCKCCADHNEETIAKDHEIKELRAKLDIAVRCLEQIVRTGYTGAEFVAREALQLINQVGSEPNE